MPIRRIAWLICGLLALAGLVLGYQAGTAPTEATVIVEWATASEVDTAGFNLYRSRSSDGPFTRINDHLIPASPDRIIGGSYVFIDTDVVAGRTYYYQLEDVELDGASTRHGPIEVVAKASSPFAFVNLAAWWPLAVLIAVLALGGAILLWWRGRRGAVIFGRDWP